MISNGLFSKSGLQEFLTEIKISRNLLFFEEISESCRDCFLRHDIDLSIFDALEMARLESKLEIKSTFFFLTTSHFYNPHSTTFKQIAKEILNLGHHIGLHFESTLYNKNMRKKALDYEINVLSEATGAEVKVLSLHNPHVENKFELYEGLINTYDAKFFGPDKYLSDSCFRFRTNPQDFITRENPIQILLHPIHYFSKSPNYISVFDKFNMHQNESLETLFENNASYLSEKEN